MRRLVLDYFRGLDGYIRDLHAAAGPDCHLVIVSDHGFAGAEKVVVAAFVLILFGNSGAVPPQSRLFFLKLG